MSDAFVTSAWLQTVLLYVWLFGAIFMVNKFRKTVEDVMRWMETMNRACEQLVRRAEITLDRAGIDLSASVSTLSDSVAASVSSISYSVGQVVSPPGGAESGNDDGAVEAGDVDMERTDISCLRDTVGSGDVTAFPEGSTQMSAVPAERAAMLPEIT